MIASSEVTGSVYPILQQLEDEGRRIWERAESWEDWGQCMGPEVIAIFGPVGVMVKSAFRAARWASGRPEREEKLRGIINRTSRELNDLMKG